MLKRNLILFFLVLLAKFSVAGNTSHQLDSLFGVLKGYQKGQAPARLLNDISEQLYYISLDSSIYFAEQAVSCHSTKKELAKAYRNLAYAYKKKVMFDSASVYFDKAVALFDELKEYDDLFWTLNSLGFMYKTKADFFNSLKTFEKQLKLAIDINKPILKASAYANLGTINFSLGCYDKEVEYNLKAMELYKQEKDSVGISRMYNNTGISYASQDKHEKALEYYHKALEINKAKGFTNGEMLNYINIAHVLQKEFNPKAALEYQNKALAIAKIRNDDIRQAIIYYNMASLKVQIKDYSNVEELLRRSLNIFIEKGDTKGVSLANRGFADYHLKTGRYDQAVNYAKKALDIAVEISARDYLIPTYQILSDAYLGMKDYKNAYVNHIKLKEISEEVFNAKKTKTIEELEVRYQVREMNQQLELRQKEIENKALIIKRKNAQTYFMVGVTIILLIFSVVVFVYSTKIRNKNKVLFNKNLELIKIENSNLKIHQKIEIEKPLIQTNEADYKDLTASKTFEKSKTSEIASNLIERLENVIIEERGYLDNELTLEKLSGLLQTNRTYVSKIINENYNLSFNNFINKLRIKSASEMLVNQEHKNLSIEGIAKEVGFNSKSAFNNAFKKFTGLTPSYYIQEIKSHPETLS